MKLSHFLILALIGLFVASTACNSKKEEQPAATDQSTVTPEEGALTAQAPATATPSTAAPATNEPHYKCPKNCEGGVGTAKGNCPVCGTEMVHNAAFHAQAGAQPGSSPQTPIQVNPTNSTSTGATPANGQTVQPPAPQNAKGDWHYVCSKACGGGAGAAGNCPKCGSPLAHNAAYHQQ